MRDGSCKGRNIIFFYSEVMKMVVRWAIVLYPNHSLNQISPQKKCNS